MNKSLMANWVALLSAVIIMISSSSYAFAADQSGTALVIKLGDGLSPAEQATIIARNGGVETASIPALRLHIIHVSDNVLATVLQHYQSDPQVLRVELDKTRKAEGTPTDLNYGAQWALPKIGYEAVFGAITPTGSAKVALLDTGIDATHPDLDGNIIPGNSILDGSNGLTDPNGHGTGLAGIIAALTNNGSGIAGVAYQGVHIMPVTVLDASANGQDSNIIAGIVWAADNGADVIIMGFSNPDFSQNLQDAVDYAWSKGAVLVAATGNDSISTPTFPAGDRGVIGVSATDPNDALATFSNYGQDVFLAAPGTNIYTTGLNGSYSYVSGTSASSAIVGGVAAFMKAVDPSLTNGIIAGRLAKSVDAIGTAGDPNNQTYFGNGRVNMANAVADTSTDSIQPAGAPPVGGGGPYVGPYVAAGRSISSITLGSQSGTVTYGTSGSVTYNVTVNTNGNGNLSTTLSVTGLPAGASPSWSATMPVTISSSSANYTLTITTSASTPAANSSFTVKATGSNKTQTGTLVVSPAALTVTAANASRTYGAANPAFTVSYSGFVNGDTAASLTTQPTATCTATASSPTGSYAIVPSGGVSNNYTFTYVNGTLTVNPAALTVTAANANRAYGAANPAFSVSYSGFMNGDTAASLTTQPTATSTATASSPVGSYAIIPSGGVSSNYTFAYANGTLTINKATPTVTAWPSASAITYGQNLASSTLTSGTALVPGSFAFTTPTTASGVGTTAQGVIFTPTDTTNYSTVTSSVNVTVNKATPSVTTWPTASAITFRQTLASSILTGGAAAPSGGSFNWTTSSATPSIGTSSQSVTYTPTDTTNYITVTGSVNVTVTKAAPIVTAWPTAGAITYGQTLASSTLTAGTASVPGSFAFTSPATAPNAGAYSAAVAFIPTDATNYSSVTGNVNVTVTKATPAVTAWPTASTITYGQALASSTLTGGTASVPGGFAFTTPTTAPGVGTAVQGVAFTPIDTTNYVTVTGSVNVTATKATPSVTTWPTASTIAYGQTLASSTLTGGTASVPGGFAFTTPTTAPGVGTAAQGVTFTPNDTTNYSTVTGSVNVMIGKADQTITFGALPNKTYGNTPFMVSATASSRLAVSFSILSGPATIAGNTVTITGAGTVVVRASQPGDTSYNAAPAQDQSFSVAPAALTVTAGSNVAVAPVPWVTMTFNSVTSSGTVSVVAFNTPPLSADFRALTGSSYELTTSATFRGPIMVGIDYDKAALVYAGNESRLRLLHFNGQDWEDITTSMDTTNKKIYGVTYSLSPFVVAEPTSPPLAKVPVFDGIWLLSGIFAGLGLLACRKK